MCIAGFSVELLLSPKSQLKLTFPTPPDCVAVKFTGWSASGVVGLFVRPTLRAGATMMTWLELAFTPSESVAVNVTVKLPGMK